MADAKSEVVIRQGFRRCWRHFAPEQGPFVQLRATLDVGGHFSTR